MKPILLTAFLLPIVASGQSITTDIKVKFDLPQTPTQLYIANDESLDSIPFPSTNEWTYKKTLPQACEVTLYISPSVQPIKFWADGSSLSITCTQGLSRTNKPKLVIQQIEGSKDAILFNARDNQPYLEYTHSRTLTRAQNDSIADALWRSTRTQFIDSVFRENPGSPVLPYFVMFYKNSIGPAVAGSFYNRLSDAAKNNKEGQRLKRYLDRSVMLQQGSIFEDFSMNDDKEKLFRLSDVKAKYILIDFWGSWCGPCRYDNRISLAPAYKEFNPKGFEIVSVSLDDDKAAWLKAIKEDKSSWKQVCDLKGDANELAVKYMITAAPFYVLLDANRKVVIFDLQPNQLRKHLIELFKN